MSCSKYFETYSGWSQKITIRGREEKQIIAGGARLYVPSHKEKRFVIAIKYEGENNYRYLMASNLSWNMKNIIELYTLRWLIEVFFEDWSNYNGFCSLAKQCGVDGSKKPVILSLLFDHCFLFHNEQQFNIENKLSLVTFGSLLEKNKMIAFFYFIADILQSENPSESLKQLLIQIDDVIKLKPSRKHLNEISMNWWEDDVA